MAEKWVQKAGLSKGGLHRTLGIPEGQKIPASDIAKAAHSSDPKERRQGILAQTFAHMRTGHDAKVAHHPRGRKHAHGAG